MRRLINKVIPTLLLISILFLFTPYLCKNTKAEPVPPVPSDLTYVYDYANLIDSSDELEMRRIAQALDKETGAQLVVVTVNDLDGKPLETYSLEILRGWGIGDREKNNGLLLLVNKENLLAGRSGRIRIEVGYGLEGAINDAKAGRILDNYALPSFSEGQYSKGITDTFMSLASEIAAEYGLDLTSGELSCLEGYKTDDNFHIIGLLFLIFILFIVITTIIKMKTKRYGRYEERRGPFIGPFGGGGSGGPFGGGFGGGGFGGGGFGGGSGGGGGSSR